MKNLRTYPADPDFETDASTFRAGNENWLFTTDEFSPEDHFRSHEASLLGWNVAAATISDILAAGGVPVYYGHSVTIQHDWGDPYIESFSKGISRCLAAAGATFIGGDLGVSDKWRYTGITIGKKMSELSRRGAKEGDIIYMTGKTGAGNLEAALNLYADHAGLAALLNRIRVIFPLRLPESALVRKYASACMDSSDGLFRALQDLARISRSGFRIRRIPYFRKGLMVCKAIGIPEEMLFLGECGEYELVFTVSPAGEKEFLREAGEQRLVFSRLGMITADEKLILEKGEQSLNLTDYRSFARNYKDVGDYIREGVRFINANFS